MALYKKHPWTAEKPWFSLIPAHVTCKTKKFGRHVKVKQITRNDRKRNFGHVRPAKIQISLRIRAVWSESSLSAFSIAKDTKILYADNEDSDQTARMRRLIWVFVGRTREEITFLRYV